MSFRSHLLGELLLASPIGFIPTVSGPRSARNLLCRPRFGSASPHLRPLATLSRPGSIDHQCKPRATLANTLSGNFITNCSQTLSTYDPSRPFRYSSITDLLPIYLSFCKHQSGSLCLQCLQALTIFASAYNLCKLPSVNLYHPSLPARSSSCLLYTSPSPRDRTRSRMPSSA